MSKQKAGKKGSSQKKEPKLPRSRVLIVDKKTGEPKHMLRALETGKPWMLVLTDENLRNRGKKFSLYSEAKQTSIRVKERHPDLEVTIVSRRVGYGPPRSRISDKQLIDQNDRGRYWCPFCRKFREFDYDPMWKLDRCPVCRIFISNFHVIRNNPRLTWEMFYD